MTLERTLRALLTLQYFHRPPPGPQNFCLTTVLTEVFMSPSLFLLVPLLPSTPPWLCGLFQFLISTLLIVASEICVLSFSDESRVLFMGTHQTTVPKVFLGLHSNQRGLKLCVSPSSTVCDVILSHSPLPHIIPPAWSARALMQVFLTQSKLG